MDRESVIQEIAMAIATIEDCSDEEIEHVKKFLRWFSDDELWGVKSNHKKALAATTIHASG